MKFCGKCNRSYGGGQVVCLVDGERLTYKDLYGFVGQLIAGKYMVHELANIGGMSAVYLAQQIGVDRRVAFKILLPNVAASNANLARLFEREAKTAGKLSHENIATIYDAGHTAEGVPYIVMEWLDGHTLESEIETGQPMGLERITYLLRQIAGAIDAAHAKHVIHRDLKPGNIMLIRRPDGRDQVKIVDFGLAKVGSQGGDMQVSEAVGTPNYASPEQFQTGSDIDPRTDIYSLGIMVYQLLTGHLPFQATTIAEAVRAHLLETPKPVTHYRPELPTAIENIINRMLAKTPQYRPDSASEVASVFEWVLADMHGEETPQHQPARPAQLHAIAAPADSQGHYHAPDDGESYSLEDLFRPVYDSPQQPSFAEPPTPRAYDNSSFGGARRSASFEEPAYNFRPASSLVDEPPAYEHIIEPEVIETKLEPELITEAVNKSQSRANASGSQQTRITNISGSRNKQQPIAVVNPAIGEGLTFPLLGLPLPGSRRQQIMAITAILLSIGLCVTLFLMNRKKPVAPPPAPAKVAVLDIRATGTQIPVLHAQNNRIA